ncbi:hypothetical protein C2G38_433486 [Gigaspora rosea]|uniref:Uncharacterized protein n=1 Tax=Gigaspora rosea TaxID=44941 RepID=A0A397UJT6_9GLOM|nr:hypothetical protein C2G38_433486 [Gigaspora rosea]
MNRLFFSIFIFLTFFFVTVFSHEKLIPHAEINPLPLKIKKAGHNKLIVEVAWDGINVKEDEPVIKRLKCFSKAVTVKDPVQEGTFGERKAQFELTVHRNNAHVKCRYGVLDGVIFKKTFTFQT